MNYDQFMIQPCMAKQSNLWKPCDACIVAHTSQTMECFPQWRKHKQTYLMNVPLHCLAQIAKFGYERSAKKMVCSVCHILIEASFSDQASSMNDCAFTPINFLRSLRMKGCLVASVNFPLEIADEEAPHNFDVAKFQFGTELFSALIFHPRRPV